MNWTSYAGLYFLFDLYSTVFYSKVEQKRWVTVEQVLCAQVDVDAAVEPRDEPIKHPLLQTQA